MAAAAAINASRGGSQPPIEQILSPPEPMTASPFFPTIIAAAGRVILPAAVGSIFSGPGDEEDDFDDDDFDDDDSDGYYEE